MIRVPSLSALLLLLVPATGCDTAEGDPTPAEPVALVTAALYPTPTAVSGELDRLYAQALIRGTSAVTYYSIGLDGQDRRVLADTLWYASDLATEGATLYGADRAYDRLFRLHPGDELEYIAQFDFGESPRQFTLVDGARKVLYYVIANTGWGQLRLRDLDTGGEVTVADSLLGIDDVAFVSDKAFTASADEGQVLFLIQAEGSCTPCLGFVVDVNAETMRSSRVGADVVRVRWLDAQFKALTLAEQGGNVIPVVEAFDGGARDPLRRIPLETEDGRFLDVGGFDTPFYNADWSPDGERLLFWRFTEEAAPGITRFRLRERGLDSGDERTLAEFDLRSGVRPHALWYDPDGDHALYWRPDDGGLVLYSLRLR